MTTHTSTEFVENDVYIAGFVKHYVYLLYKSWCKLLPNKYPETYHQIFQLFCCRHLRGAFFL